MTIMLRSRLRRADAATAVAAVAVRRKWRVLSQPFSIFAIAILAIIVLCACFASVIAPHPPNVGILTERLLPPGSPGHLLGTDGLGRDVLSRMLYGAQTSLLAALLAVAVGAAIGFVPGFLAGHLGGRTDWVVMRATDVLLSIPPLILALTVIAALGPGLTNAMFAVGIVFAPRFARIARAGVLPVKSELYIEAARSMGIGTAQIMFRHVLRKALPPVIVTLSVLASSALVTEAGLSFVGLGVQPPDSSWGTLIADGYQNITQAAWLILWPGLAIAITVLCLNIVGDLVRDSLGAQFRDVGRQPS